MGLEKCTRIAHVCTFLQKSNCYVHIDDMPQSFFHFFVYNWASEASPTWAIHLGFFIYYILLSYVRRGLCDPLFFFFGVRCAQYKVHAQCSFAALAPHMPCMLLVIMCDL